MLKAQFDNPDVQINNIQGYRITARLNPMNGLQNQFYIYIASVFSASARLKAVTFDDVAGARPGNLQIAGETRNYSFGPVDLIRVHAGATRRERYQVLEFRANFMKDEQPRIDVSNEDPVLLHKLASLGDDYKFSVDGGEAEHLLGFSAVQDEEGAQVYRFNSLRNQHNSWLGATLKWHDAILSDDTRHEIDVRFSQGDFKLNRESVNLLYVDEAYGLCQSWPGYELKDILNPAAKSEPGSGLGARLPLWTYRLDDLMEHEARSQTEYAVPTLRRAVQSATILFKQGFNHRLNII